jgi:hypothetical protein
MAEIHITIDIEADGPIPGTDQYSMIALGASIAGWRDTDGYRPNKHFDATTFYSELQPISGIWVPAALAVSGLDRDVLSKSGEPPLTAMSRFRHWVRKYAGQHRPVAVLWPVGFDWLFMYWYLMAYGNDSPFSFSGHLDFKSLTNQRLGGLLQKTGKRELRQLLRSSGIDFKEFQHTHKADEDAIELASLYNAYRSLP